MNAPAILNKPILFSNPQPTGNGTPTFQSIAAHWKEAGLDTFINTRLSSLVRNYDLTETQVANTANTLLPFVKKQFNKVNGRQFIDLVKNVIASAKPQGDRTHIAHPDKRLIAGNPENFAKEFVATSAGSNGQINIGLETANALWGTIYQIALVRGIPVDKELKSLAKLMARENIASVTEAVHIHEKKFWGGPLKLSETASFMKLDRDPRGFGPEYNIRFGFTNDFGHSVTYGFMIGGGLRAFRFNLGNTHPFRGWFHGAVGVNHTYREILGDNESHLYNQHEFLRLGFRTDWGPIGIGIFSGIGSTTVRQRSTNSYTQAFSDVAGASFEVHFDREMGLAIDFSTPGPLSSKLLRPYQPDYQIGLRFFARLLRE